MRETSDTPNYEETDKVGDHQDHQGTNRHRIETRQRLKCTRKGDTQVQSSQGQKREYSRGQELTSRVGFGSYQSKTLGFD